MTTQTEPRFFSEFKKSAVTELLAKSVGIIAKGKDCIAICLNAPSVLYTFLRDDNEAKVFLWGISGTEAAKRDFLSELNSFMIAFRKLFSPRDLNLAVVSEFISEYLQENLYSRRSEKPLALEFFLMQLSCKGEIFYTVIDFMGETKSWGAESNFIVIGCTDRKAREKINAALSDMKLDGLSAEELQASLRSLTSDFGGESFEAELSLGPEEEPKEKPGPGAEEKS